MKKNGLFLNLKNGLRQKLLMMNLTAFFLMATFLQVSAGGYSQKISISLKNVPVEKLFKEIENQSEYRFFYNEKILKNSKTITIDVKNVSVETVLQLCLEEQSFSYVIDDKQIILKAKEVSIQNEIVPIDPIILPPPPIVFRGLVTNEEGKVLNGVSVLIKGSIIGTSTDEKGAFYIEIPDGYSKVLVLSFVGMLNQEVNTVGKTYIKIKMLFDEKLEKDIIVIGYGSQRKKDLTGSIVSLGEEKFKERNVVSLLQAMAGQAAGVQIAPRNASPGKPSTVIIRGIGSITAGFAPLYVIDGFPVDQQNADALNPNDIMSVDVLKDASATAIYGSRGANGVIIITTKTGIKGKSSLNFNASYGSSKVNENDFFKMLDSKEYVTYMKEAAQNSGTAVRTPIANWDGSTNTNWQKLIYQTAPFSNYSLTGTGGSDNLTYNWSLGYVDEVGIVKGTDFKKITARVRVDYNPSKKFHVGLSMAPSYQMSNNMPDGDFNSPMGAAVFMPPIIPVRMPDGSYGNTQKFPGIADIQIANPLEIIELYKDKTNGNLSMVNSVIEYEILNGLKLKSTIGVNTSSFVNETFTPSTLPPLPHSPSATYNNSSYLNWANENTITYNKVFKKDHSINLLGGFTSQRQDNTNVYTAANNYPTNFVETLNGGVITPSATGTTKTAWSLLSYLARANYSYKGRYILTGSIRTDGSSRFGENERYGVFPSAAVAWRLSEEPFMQSLTFVNNAKLRASYGRTGNNLIANFASIGLLGTVNQPFGLGGGSNIIGLTNLTSSNPNLTWEIADQKDFGVDFSFFKNKLNITFDYYDKVTQSLLLNVNVTSTSGYPSVLQNIGKMKTTGIELTANYKILDGAFKWNIGGNLATMNQEVLKLGIDGSPLIGFYGTLVTKVGGKLEEGRGLQSLGILSQKDIDSKIALFGSSKAGDYKFKDVNGDGIVDGFNQADGVLLGSNNPKLIFGITSSVSYKNFDMSVLILGQQGATLYDLFYQLGGIGGGNGINSHSFYYDGRYVSAANPGDGKTPRAGYFGAGTPNNYYQQSTDYTRIRNITLGYNIPVSVYAKSPIKSLRAYITADNLGTFTTFLGGNPNTSRQGSGNASTGDGRFIGLNSIPSVPLPMSFSFGVNVNF